MNMFLDLKVKLNDITDRLDLLKKIKPQGFNAIHLENEIKTLQVDFKSMLLEMFDQKILESIEDICNRNNIGLYSEEFIDKLKSQYAEERLSKPRIFFDMDGVLFKSEDRIESLDIFYEQGYFSNLPIHRVVAESFQKLLEEDPYQTYIISHFVDSPYAKKEKMESIQKFFPTMDRHFVKLVPYGESKSLYVPEGISQKDILIDDYNPNLKDWEKHGGTAIKMVNEFNDKNGNWKGARLYFDDPKLLDELHQLVSYSELGKSINAVIEQQVEKQKMNEFVK